ncbi:hypothetical protein IMAU30077_01568 [Lactobacillus helveticus]|uniref:hypothetical protein n=1 Tax=Lactobacillus helveticus TaxID=1587 RepID=UPI0015657A11|nr:hypothetical protein [Lactobacillus helveticus]NRN87828.1 hypothetical protein [Lactobacillus helveticus]
MKNKVIKNLALISASLALVGTITVTAPTKTVNAVSDRTFSKYSRKFHRVVVTSPIWVFRIYPRYPMYKTKYVKAYLLKPGDRPLVRHRGVDWGWTVGKSYRYCILKDSFSWFEGYEKYKWIDQGLLDGKFKDEHFSYRFTWKQFCKLCSLNVLNNDYYVTRKDWRTKIRPLIKKWKPETEKDY